MTDKIWKCDKCGYERYLPIYFTMGECPECKAKYIHLATIYGLHVSHTIEVEALEGTPFEDVDPFKGFLALAMNSGSRPQVVCHNKEFYNFLDGNNNENIIRGFKKDEEV